MEPSTFTIEFHPHLSAPRWDDCLQAVSTAGASLTPLSSHAFELTCIKQSHLQHVGYLIYNSPHSQLLTVTSATGSAQLAASAYSSPKLPPNNSFKGMPLRGTP